MSDDTATRPLTWQERWRGEHLDLQIDLRLPDVDRLAEEIDTVGATDPAVEPVAEAVEAVVEGGVVHWDGNPHPVAGGRLHLFDEDALRYDLQLEGGGQVIGTIALPSATQPGNPDTPDAPDPLDPTAPDAIAQLGRLTVTFTEGAAQHHDVAHPAEAFPPLLDPVDANKEAPDPDTRLAYRRWLRGRLSERFVLAPLAPEGVPLDDGEWRVVALAFRAFFPDRDPRGPTPGEVADRLEAYLRLAKPGYFAVLRPVLKGLDHIARLVDFLVEPFLERVAATLDDPQSEASAWVRTMHDVLVFTHYAHPRADRILGYGRPEPSPPGRAEPIAVVEDPDEAAALFDEPWDVVVVGSGPAGGIVADRLVAAGHRVLMLEEGPFVPPTHTNTDELKGIAELYKDSGLAQGRITEGEGEREARFVILQGGCVGGGASVNNAICFRMHPATLRRWRGDGFPVSAEALDSAYDRIADELGIRPIREVEPEHLQNPAYRYVAARWGAPAEPPSGAPAPGFHDLLVNVAPGDEPCLGLGLSNIGTYSFRKRSVVEIHLPRVTASGRGKLVAGARVTRLDVDDGRVTGLRLRFAGKKHRLRARHVVLCAGAVGTPTILHASKAFRDRPVGERFSCNLATPLFAAYDEEVGSAAKVQMSHYFNGASAGDMNGESAEPEWLVESWFNPPASHALVMPGFRNTHQARMADYAKTVGFGIVVSSRPRGRVGKKGEVTLDLGDDELRRLKGAFRAGLDALFAEPDAGLRYALIAYRRGLVIERPYQIGLALADMTRVTDLVLSTSHPQGGAAMSLRNDRSVVDSQFRVHGATNLRVADASLFPRAVGVNPQWTVMALADLCARSLLDDLAQS